jgi:MYXO-CTERM domain-containing protein
MSITVRRAALAPIVAAALAAMATASVHAQSVVYTGLTATGKYRLNNDASATSVAPWLDTATAKDVLEFGNAGPSAYGMHSYGGTDGTFGSRSSGNGVYDVTGSFTISLTLTNNSGTARSFGFDFYITPGYLNASELPYTGNQFTEAGVNFDITASKNNSAFASFNSAATVRADKDGVHFTPSGDTSLYGGTGASRTVVGGSRHLDLGVLNAGESLDLTYSLGSYAKGDAVFDAGLTIPGYTEVIPGHWVEYLDCGYGNPYGEPTLQKGDFAATASFASEGSCTTVHTFIEEQIIEHPPETVGGTTGGSQGSSGDPFSFTSDPTGTFSPLPPGLNSQFSITGDVPEPAGFGLAALALGALAFSRRRQR